MHGFIGKIAWENLKGKNGINVMMYSGHSLRTSCERSERCV